MPDITFILPDGSALGFEAPDNVSLMQAATGFDHGCRRPCAFRHDRLDQARPGVTDAGRAGVEECPRAFADFHHARFLLREGIQRNAGQEEIGHDECLCSASIAVFGGAGISSKSPLVTGRAPQ